MAAAALFAGVATAGAFCQGSYLFVNLKREGAAATTVDGLLEGRVPTVQYQVAKTKITTSAQEMSKAMGADLGETPQPGMQPGLGIVPGSTFQQGQPAQQSAPATKP